MNTPTKFQFDGGAGTYLGTQILAMLVTMLTLGIAYPYALVLVQRWKTKHTLVNGVRLQFTGTGIGLFGNWIKWLFLMIITLGIYGFWVVPRITKWIVEHTELDAIITQPIAVANLSYSPSPVSVQPEI